MNFSKLSNKHLPLLSLWYREEKTKTQLQGKLPLEQWIAYVDSIPNYFSWIVYDDNTPIGSVDLEISLVSSQGHASIFASPYSGKGYEDAMLLELLARPEVRHTRAIYAWINSLDTPKFGLFQKLEFIRQPSDNGGIEFVRYLP